jgi:NADH-quinone oxidoreductase subunit J
MDGVLLVAGAMAVVFAIAVVVARNPFFGALALIGHLASLAVMFLGLDAQFVAAAQVVIYAGAIVVLFLFVIAYLGLESERLATEEFPIQRIAAFLLGGLLLGEVSWSVGRSDIDLGAAKLPDGFGTTRAVGDAFVNHFLAVFEMGSFVLLVASVGAVVLARRRARDGTLTFDTEAQLATAAFQRRRAALPPGVTIEQARPHEIHQPQPTWDTVEDELPPRDHEGASR